MKRNCKIRILFAALLVAAAAFLTSCSLDEWYRDFFDIAPNQPDYVDSGTVRVLLGESEGITITSPNPVDVKVGDAVSFDYTVNDGYEFEGVEGATVADGKILLDNVRYPTTLRASVRRLPIYAFNLISTDEKGGTVTADHEAGQYWEGTKIILSATLNSNYAFLGFSAGITVADGGDILTKSLLCSYTLSSDTTLYANYKRVSAVVTLDLPEGITANETKQKVTLGADTEFTLTAQEGYTLVSVEGGKLVGNRVVVRSVNDDVAVKVTARKLDRYTCEIMSTAGGSASVTAGADGVWEGGEITVKAQNAAKYSFVSFTADKPAAEGGKVVSIDPEYTFAPTQNVKLYANFVLSQYTVSVNLSGAPGVTLAGGSTAITGENGTVIFPMTLALGTVIDSVSGGTVEDGRIVVTNVVGNKTVTVRSHVIPHYTVLANTTNASYGTVTASSAGTVANQYADGTVLTLTATEKDAGRFAGFTVGAPLSQGGTLVSYSEYYTFTVSENVTVYANFNSAPYDPAQSAIPVIGKWTIYYHANGGINAKTGKNDYRIEYFSNEYYLCPNTLPDMNYFTREGYILVGYNTREDGKGRYYGLGWNVVMDDRTAISLYCMWEKVSNLSDFTYTTNATGATITGYKGKDATVVIPETIGGKKVTNLAAGFLKNNAYVTKLVISKSVKTIAAKAVDSCARLTTIHYPDSITSCPDTFYTNCPKFTTVQLQATCMPYRSATRVGTYAIKFENLLVTKGKKIVLVSGSNGAWGTDSPLLEELLADAGYDFTVINYGCSAGTASVFYVEVISHFIGEGDILVHQPEVAAQSYGWNDINTTLFDFFEGAYDAFSYIDVQKYNKVFSTFSSFFKTRESSSAKSDYETYVKTELVNKNGDCAWEYHGTTSGNNTSIDKYEAQDGVIQFASGVSYIKQYCATINRAFDMVAANGGEVVSSFASVVSAYLKPESRTTGSKQQTDYEAAVDTYLHTTRISAVADYIFDRSLFYNSQWHLNCEGKAIRTPRLADDLIAYLSKKK